jgi:cyclophilin family peptidyl-prolyl cis-trans isomerase
LFINLKDNSGSLDGRGFSPFGRIVSGMEAVDKITSEYGERPQQSSIEQQGNVYLEREFPNMDYVKTAKVEGTDKDGKADKTQN